VIPAWIYDFKVEILINPKILFQILINLKTRNLCPNIEGKYPIGEANAEGRYHFGFWFNKKNHSILSCTGRG
jgi:hypothetical protein